MKASLLWLCLFIVSLASIEGRTSKKANSIKFHFKLAKRIDTRQRDERWRKETSKEKNIRCFVVNSGSPTVRCSLVKKCPNQDPTCSTFRQVRRTSETHEKRIKKVSTTQKTTRVSKCSDKKNPFCIHDIWTGRKRSYENPISKTEENILSTLCDPEDKTCIVNIKRAKGNPKLPFKMYSDEGKSEPEGKMIKNGRHSSAGFSSWSKTGCDFIRDPNCKLEGSLETPQKFKDVLKRLQDQLPTTKRQKNCKGKTNKICRWRPQPNDVKEIEDQRPLNYFTMYSKSNKNNNLELTNQIADNRT
ncbi:uncharacterized protein LOC116302281 isoform X2 [Actinia tenebrosa]|nr:uncharacterized protein LOC116302281 isoform X2 [Actinia tenebrosa]XP_031567385.1 uncharacterized protein LOC116302281 isoform X2 [Actinia tenebrosa]